MVIKSKAELIKKMDEIAKKSLIELGQKVKEMWEDHIYYYFYNQYSPVQYQRTFQLLDSVVTTLPRKQGNKWILNIFMDWSNVEYETEEAKTVFLMAAEGIHGNDSIQTDGRFYDELIKTLETGVLFDEYEKKLNGMGLTISKKYS